MNYLKIENLFQLYLKANDDIFLSPIKGYKNNNTFLSTSVSYQF